ncbi:MAG TPA: 4-(cytidine 5'-diphospho)-2-C-methyl-D-erythritol kinase [Burkholderiales bacterium]|nr:4-(cytidine 5'-diphospho)-2-C-methyl-D-erythritol kinase [Burkholderiales bacterium]
MSLPEVFPAPAKLNLFLQVVGRRPDGYHLLQTVFRFIDYSDLLRLRVRKDGVLRQETPLPGVPVEQDLILRAARLLQEAAGCRLGADIALEKRVPMGGGLGGGSSDAATVLIALNRLWGLNLRRRELMELALRLGADVPVFVFGQNAFAEGVGEALTPLALPPNWYVVLVPPVPVTTADVFSAPELTRDARPIKIADFSVALGHNALQAVVCRRHPEVARHLQWLSRFGSASMTGSGACVFAEFASADAAQAVLEQQEPGMRGFVARGLDQHPLKELVED